MLAHQQRRSQEWTYGNELTLNQAMGRQSDICWIHDFGRVDCGCPHDEDEQQHESAERLHDWRQNVVRMWMMLYTVAASLSVRFVEILGEEFGWLKKSCSFITRAISFSTVKLCVCAGSRTFGSKWKISHRKLPDLWLTLLGARWVTQFENVWSRPRCPRVHIKLPVSGLYWRDNNILDEALSILLSTASQCLVTSISWS